MHSFNLPLKVFDTRLTNAVVDIAHYVDQLTLHLRRTHDGEPGHEVLSDFDQGISWPERVPVNRAPGYQTRELQRPTAEVLSHLRMQFH